jgi:DHA1 family bicyclomycin/chloramphenicol resistance-like MFS transporter
MAVGITVCGLIALGFVLVAEKGRLFVARNAPPATAAG